MSRPARVLSESQWKGAVLRPAMMYWAETLAAKKAQEKLDVAEMTM